MDLTNKKPTAGFTLMELMVALTLGLVLMAASVQIFSSAVNATWSVSQRAEMQQDFRSASGLLLRDISLAGSGIGDTGVALPSGNSVPAAVYGCDTAGCDINGTSVAFPIPPSGTVPTLYGVVPGPNFGIKVNGKQSDTITVAYTDNVFLLNCYQAKITSSTTATFTDPTTLAKPQTYPSSCVIPASLKGKPQAVNDSVVGLTQGDLVLFELNVTVGSGATAVTTTVPVIGEVTVVSAGSGPYTVTFATGALDPMKMNQPTATNGNLATYSSDLGSAYRLDVITYYLDFSPADGVTPRLMRKVDGHSSVPVAENVSQLNFDYDLYTGSTLLTHQADGGATAGYAPTMITKVNLLNLTMRSPQKGLKGYQGMNLQTTMSVRNLTFTNNYPVSSN